MGAVLPLFCDLVPKCLNYKFGSTSVAFFAFFPCFVNQIDKLRWDADVYVVFPHVRYVYRKIFILLLVTRTGQITMDFPEKTILKRVIRECDKLRKERKLSEYGAGQRELAIVLLGADKGQSFEQIKKRLRKR